MMLFVSLIIEFFKTGLFAIGGGLATLPFLYEIADKYDWLDASMMGDMIAVSESTPGPIGVNMATYAGFNAGSSLGSVWLGILGGVTATFALVLPSVIIIIIVAKFLDKFSSSMLVKNSFEALRPTVCGMIAAAGISVFSGACLHEEFFGKVTEFAQILNVEAIAMFAVLFVVSRFVKCHPVFLIIPAAVVGILLKL